MARRLLLALVLLPLFAGCLTEQRLDFACRARDGAPTHPYDDDALAALVRFDGGAGTALSEEARAALLAQAARQVLTPDGAPYDAFAGVLRPMFPARPNMQLQTWLFEANGTWPGGRDAYSHAFLVRDGIVQPPQSELVAAPARLRDAASSVANASDEATTVLARKPDLVAAAWDPARPSCLVLQYGCRSGDGRACGTAVAVKPVEPTTPPTGVAPTPTPAPTPAPGPATYVWVDLPGARVVAVEEPAA